MNIINRFFGYLFTCATAPIWIAQGISTKRIALRLPEACGERRQLKDEHSNNVELMVIGDSVAAGVGIESIHNALPGQLTQQLALSGLDSTFQIIARSGDKIADIIAHIESTDMLLANKVVISVGVNDAKGFTSSKKWKTQLKNLLELIETKAPNAKIVLMATPPLEQFPLLPRPLSIVLGCRSTRLNQVSEQLVGDYENVTFYKLVIDSNEAHFAKDGFHPSELSCNLLAKNIVQFF